MPEAGPEGGTGGAPVTTPGGVPNLPAGALTLDTLAAKLQDMSATAMRRRAAERMPSIFDASTGGSILSDLSPFGIITRIWAEVNSLVAQADPADIQGPEDLPPLLLEFIEGLPVIGELVGLLEAILGTYDGDDEVLLEIQKIFGLIRSFFGGIDFQDPPTPEEMWENVTEELIQPFIKSITKITAALLGPLSIGFLTDEIQSLLYEGGFDDPITIVQGDGITHDATDGAPGSTPLGCARVQCDGTYKMRWTEPLKVGKDWTLKAGADVKYQSLVAAAGSNAVRVELMPYKGESSPQPVVWMASDESPSGTEPWGPLNAWETYVVPADVTHVAIGWGTSEDATSGVVKFDNVYLQATQKIPQGFTKDLPEDLASLLNFVRTWVESALSALGINPSGNLLDDIFDLSDEIEWIRDRAEDGFNDAAEALANLQSLAHNLLTNPAAVLGNISLSMVEGLTGALSSLSGNINSAISDISQAIFAGWRGSSSGSTGTVAEIRQTIEIIQKAVYGGYIVETIVSNQTWTRPFDPAECLEFWAVPVGGGGRGQTGDTARLGTDEVRTVDGGLGGIDGGYNAVQLDPASIPDTVACTIGPAASTPGATGGVTSFGSLAQSVPGIGAISNGVGFLASASKPGRGGDGGSAFMSRANSTTYTSSPGKAGEGSALAAGGAPGAANGGTGGAGATAPMTGERKAGGGGGAGGGGRAGNQSGTITGGTGGNGGFPGGASGGGGAAINIGTIGFNVAPGPPGTPANGCLFLIYKLASGDDD
ncbi:minor tail protein [Mycobacterium phage IdentityCrisis]|uniref:Minor tail protein n=1 Tax=Mycobacterium phage IdentityCrisis TaxID=2599866 RepID=A0A5J6TJX0_9CAUD|nr:minor tail protein [Mycobacterium phage IdentityCrisis]QFG10039.1 minor tail protein [Mycobacterium phage IdentityCrisis]